MSRRRVTSSPIDLGKIFASIRDKSAGGTVIFIGTVRDMDNGRAVRGLEYEVYREMAERKMSEIEEQAREQWRLKKITTIHRCGNLRVGEVSVAVAVSSEHRAEAFEACRFMIDSIKHTVPIWKREKTSDGKGDWVKGAPMGNRFSTPPRRIQRDSLSEGKTGQ
jgi:molybdopterin synthase catalytic subunit